jgi:putative acetyltransferase
MRDSGACADGGLLRPGYVRYMTVVVRPYVALDAERTLEIFFAAVRRTAAGDYSAEQVAAWAGTSDDRRDWARQRAAANTAVAELDGRVVGFVDIDHSGYIDMLFVAPEAGRRGVGSALLTWAVEQARQAGVAEVRANVSITARPLFKAHGFQVEAERRPVVRGVEMPNFSMRRTLSAL